MLLRTCNATVKPTEHIDFAHYGKFDRCLCGKKTTPCDGDCGLEDMSFIPYNPLPIKQK